jgi:transposase-like protein
VLKPVRIPMSSTQLFCPNIDCPARGQVGKKNIGVHDQKKKRYICHVCQHTFSASKGILFYRLRTEPKTVLLVIALLVYGCPVQAIVQAFGIYERTVRNWRQRAGSVLATSLIRQFFDRNFSGLRLILFDKAYEIRLLSSRR